MDSFPIYILGYFGVRYEYLREGCVAFMDFVDGIVESCDIGCEGYVDFVAIVGDLDFEGSISEWSEDYGVDILCVPR